MIACADARARSRRATRSNNCRARGADRRAGHVRRPAAAQPRAGGPTRPAPRRARRRHRPRRRRRRRPPPRRATPTADRRPPTPTADADAAARARSRSRRCPPAERPAADVAPDPRRDRADDASPSGTEFLYTGADPIQKEVDAGHDRAEAGRRAARPRPQPDGADAGTRPIRCRRARDRPRPPRVRLHVDARRRRLRPRRQRRRGRSSLHVEQDGFATRPAHGGRAVAGLRRHRGRRDDAVPTEGHADRRERGRRCRSSPATTVSDDDGAAPGDADVRARHRRDDGAPGRHDEAARRPRGARDRVHGRRRRRRGDARRAAGHAAPTRTPSSSASTRRSRPAPPTSRFTKPVATYVDNFLGFPAGTIVPAAYYDEARGRVGAVRERPRDRSSPSGGVDVDRRRPTDDRPRAELTKSASTRRSGEARGSSTPPASRLWRVEVQHFTPWDYNWPYGCEAECDPPDEDPPPPPYCPECEAAGSIIGVFNQTLGERLRVTGHAVRAALRDRPRARLQGGLPARDPAHRADDPAARCAASSSR